MAWKRSRTSLSYCDQANELPTLKKEFPEFKTIGSQTIQSVLIKIDQSFQSFYKYHKSFKTKKSKPRKDGQLHGFPRFKSTYRYNSLTLTSQAGWSLNGRDLKINKIGSFRLYLSRPIEGEIKTITIKRRSNGSIYVSFICINVPTKELPKTNKSIGLDMGLTHYITDSDGRHIDNPCYFKNSQKKLANRQRKLALKEFRSKNWVKNKILIDKSYEKIVNQKKDFLHKLSNFYIKNYQIICIEDLDIKSMIENDFSKSIADASWGRFFYYLGYKAEDAGRLRIKVNPKGTSQRCCRCGRLVPKDLSVRIHDCPYCGLRLHRDINSAINVLGLGTSLAGLPFNIEETISRISLL